MKAVEIEIDLIQYLTHKKYFFTTRTTTCAQSSSAFLPCSRGARAMSHDLMTE